MSQTIPSEANRPSSGRNPLAVIPRVEGVPLLGVMPNLLVDPLQTMLDATRKHGDAVCLRIGPKDCYLFAHPEHAHTILSERSKIYSKESSLWEAAQTLVGKGLGTTDGELWLKQRRALQPQFQRGRLADICTIMADETKKQLDALAARLGQPMSLFNEVRRIVWQVFFKTLFDTSATEAELETLIRVTESSLSTIDRLVWTASLPSWMPRPGLRRYHASIAELDTIIYRIIDERLRRPTERDDLLNLILEGFETKVEADAHARREVRDQVATMILATQEGPSLSLGWTVVLLCQHAEAEAKVREEIAAVHGGRTSIMGDVARLSYTRAVFDEALRLYPPLWLTVRLAKQDDVIDGFRVPAGSFVFVNAYHIQRHPLFWERPDTFDPTRFLGERAASIPRGAYLPLGLGPHLCIGKHYAMMFGTLFLGEFYERFRVRLAPGTVVDTKGVVTLRPRHPITVTLHAARQ